MSTHIVSKFTPGYSSLVRLRELNIAHLIALDPSSKGLIITTAQNNQEAYLRAQAQFGQNAFVVTAVA